MTFPREVRLGRHPNDLDDDGHLLVENLVTTETDTDLRLAPDGAGGVEWSTGGGSSSSGMVPYYIAADETFTVPLYKQALYAMEIDDVGTLEVLGYLLEVT